MSCLIQPLPYRSYADMFQSHSLIAVVSIKLIRQATLSLFIALELFLITVATSFASDKWYPIKERSLEVAEGSVLDFSSLNQPKPAGASGWIQVDQEGHLNVGVKGKSQRFLCASLVPGGPNGGIPDKAEADRWIAQFKRTGYNLVRLHFIDAILMSGRKDDFDFDPVALDRLHYLMAGLKSAGIYWVVDGLTSDNGAYGNVMPHRWVKRHDLKERLFYEPEVLDHWKRLVTTLWGRTNPYTGLAPLHDPAMLGIILVNEGGMGFLSTVKGSYPRALQKQFSEWQSNHARASGKSALLSHVSVPEEIRGKKQESRDFARFIAQRENELFTEMDRYVRTKGFKGLTTTYDNFGFYHADVARSSANWIDMHAYQSLPSQYADVGSKMAQTSIFDNAGRYGRELTNARQWGKPFTVTEYGQPFWNQWRHESTAWIPALAAFQGWDAICQFAELPVLLEYSKSGPPRRLAMYPFGVGADPIARAGERLAALLFLRGDVAPSRVRVKLGLDPEQVFADGNAWGQIPENLSRLALVAASGLDLSKSSPMPKSGQEIYFALDSRSRSWVEKAENEALKRGFLISKDPVERLKASRLLSRSNRTDLSEGLYETDTGQMLFDAPQKRLSIITERTVVFTQRSGSAKGGGVELAALSSPATIAVGAVDNQVIERSSRMLVWVLTDAMNTGMEFADLEKRTTLKTLGRFPPQIRAVTGRLAIKHSQAGTLKVWAVDQAGGRVAMVPAKAAGGFLRFAIDNVVPGVGPVTYFEVADR